MTAKLTKQAAPVASGPPPSIMAASNACDEAARRIDVVLGMIETCMNGDDAGGYAYSMIEEALEKIGDLLRKGSAEHIAAMAAGRGTPGQVLNEVK